MVRPDLRARAPGPPRTDGVHRPGRPVHRPLAGTSAAAGHAPALRARRRRQGGDAGGARGGRRRDSARDAGSTSATPGETTSRSSTTRTSNSRRLPRCCTAWASSSRSPTAPSGSSMRKGSRDLGARGAADPDARRRAPGREAAHRPVPDAHAAPTATRALSELRRRPRCSSSTRTTSRRARSRFAAASTSSRS